MVQILNLKSKNILASWLGHILAMGPWENLLITSQYISDLVHIKGIGPHLSGMCNEQMWQQMWKHFVNSKRCYENVRQNDHIGI